jgi:hypothetical protein
MMVLGPEPDRLPTGRLPAAGSRADPRPDTGRRARRTAQPDPEHRRR